MATILIVDDRKTNRELLITLLGYVGHRVLDAAGGEQGLAIARAENPDLIITDIVMPKMDGYEFARQIRADPSINNTQIIFYTSSYIIAETRRLAEACGVSIVISKPIEPEELLEQVRIALATTQAPIAPPMPESFHREHMRVLTDNLVKKVDELEAEIVERQRAEQKIERQNQRLKVLREIDTAILAADSLEEIIRAALNHIRELIDCRRANLTLIDRESNESMVFDVSMVNETVTPKGRRFPLAQYQDVVQTLSQNHVLLMNDLRALEDPRPAIQTLIQEGLRSTCSLPLFSQGNLVGIFSMHSETPNFFSEEKVSLASEVANQVAIAMTQNRMIESLRRGEQRYRSIFESAAVAIWEEDFSDVLAALQELKLQGVTDLRKYLLEHPEFIVKGLGMVKVLDVNQQSLKMFGAVDKQELLNSLDKVFLPETMASFADELALLFEGGRYFEAEAAIQTLQGERRDALVTIQFGEPGEKLDHTLVSLMDITERKRAAGALEEKERLLSESQRIGHIGSWSYDISADTLQCSDEMYRLFDIAAEELEHNKEGFVNLVYSGDQAEAGKWLELIASGRQVRELNLRILRRNGELRYVQMGGAVIFDPEGNPANFTGTMQDITERKLAEIQIHQQIDRLSALRTIDTAITSSFDLRSNLNTVLSQAVKQLHVDAADILFLDSEQEILKYAAGIGFRTRLIEDSHIPMGDSLAGRAAQQRRLVRIDNLKAEPHNPLLTQLRDDEDFVCYFGVPLITKGKVQGVLEIFHRLPLHPYPEWIDFLETLAGQAAIAIDNASLFDNLEQSNLNLTEAYDATITGWSRAIDLRDKETEGHSQRVTTMTLNLARTIGMSESQLIQIRRGALLHDIGKLGVPDHILLKPDKLTDEEWQVMRQHPAFAYEMLSSIKYLEPALDIPYCHHEKWDGTGYPRGLKGEQIPLAARIFSVVDVWDAVTSDRPYRQAWTKEQAVKFIKENSGSNFDPRVVDEFLEFIKH